jgi:hypothetical protein
MNLDVPAGPGRSNPSITIFPNPVRGRKLHLKGAPQGSQASLFDLSGRQVAAQMIYGEVFDLGYDLAPGIYQLAVSYPGFSSRSYFKVVVLGNQ